MTDVGVDPHKCPQSDCDNYNGQLCSGKGYRVCSINPASGCLELGPSVSCRDDGDMGLADCSFGHCGYTNSGCVASPRVILLVDRSSSMLQQKLWGPTRIALNIFVREYWNHADFALRVFPGGDTGCGVGALVLEKDMPTPDDFTKLLKDPAGDGATALADALANIVIGDVPEDETHVVLITDGQETCKSNNDVYDSIYKLRSRGIKVHVIGVGSTFDGQLLQQVALLGGTGQLHVANGGHEVYRALLEVSEAIKFCCIDHDGDGFGRHCGAEDCNDGNPSVKQLTSNAECTAKTCGIDSCGYHNCGVCGPEGDMDGLQQGAPWPQAGFSPTQQRRSPNNAPPLVFQSAKLYELDWATQWQNLEWSVSRER